VTDHESIGLSQSLETGSEIGDFSQCQLFLTPCSTHFTDYDETRMYPKSYRQGNPFGWLQPGVEGFYCL
jgi:hypothetical protein